LSRSALLHLLPDFSEAQPRPAPSREPGFEPLVHEALSRDEFTTLDMPAGFTGLNADPFAEPADPFADIGSAMDAGELDLSGLEADVDDLPDPFGGEPGLDSLYESETALPPADLLDLDQGSGGAEDGAAVREMLEEAHRAEIERIEAAHREALDHLVTTAIPKIKEDVVAAIAADLAPLVSGRIRADIVTDTLDSLVAEVTALLEDTDAVGFELRGPEGLLSAFMDKWSGDASQVRLVPGSEIDLVARVGRSVLATRLFEIDRLLQEAMS
jgi:hypothetical protein